MNTTLPTGQCKVDWCDQGDRPHRQHELTVGTWIGTSKSPPARTLTAQLVIHGYATQDAIPMLALVDGLNQTDVDLTWDQLHELATAGIAETARFRRLNTPE